MLNSWLISDLATAVKVLQTHRDAYYEIDTSNSGTVKNDSAVDIDGAIFTLGYYAKLGDTLGDVKFLHDGDSALSLCRVAHESGGPAPHYRDELVTRFRAEALVGAIYMSLDGAN